MILFIKLNLSCFYYINHYLQNRLQIIEKVPHDCKVRHQTAVLQPTQLKTAVATN